MPRPFRIALALIAVLAAAASLAACGGSDNSSADAKQLLKETFSGDHKVTSGKLNVQLKVDAERSSGKGTQIQVALTGPFQSRGKGNVPQFDLSAQIQASGQNINAGAITNGTQGWIEFNNQAYSIPPKVWNQFVASYTRAQARSGRRNQGLGTLKTLGINPEQWLNDPKVEGDETVGGVETTHISTGVDVSKLLDSVSALTQKASALGNGKVSQLPQKISAAQRQKVADAVKSADVDVYTGKDDKTLRKISLALDIEPKSGGVKSAKVDLSIEIDDLNQPQTITPPANAKPLSDLTSQLSGLGLLGGLGGGAGSAVPGSSSGGSSSGGGGAPSTAEAQKRIQQYTQCLQKAGNDVTEAQKCAAVLRGG